MSSMPCRSARCCCPWRNGSRPDWQTLPARRIDLAGRPEEHFIAQFAGDPAVLPEVLASQGWTAVPVWSWRESLPYLNPKASLAELPPRPALHEGLKAKLTLIRKPGASPDEREVLRLYKTGLAAAEGDLYKPIYLVSLTREVRSDGFNLYAIPALAPARPEDVAALRAALSGAQASASWPARSVTAAPRTSSPQHPERQFGTGRGTPVPPYSAAISGRFMPRATDETTCHS